MGLACLVLLIFVLFIKKCFNIDIEKLLICTEEMTLEKKTLLRQLRSTSFVINCPARSRLNHFNATLP